MTKFSRYKTHLIAVHQRHEPVRVYAVVAETAGSALDQVRVLATEDMQIELVGGLSRDMARRLGLKPYELRLI